MESAGKKNTARKLIVGMACGLWRPAQSAKLRAAVKRASPEPKLNLGSGGRNLPGWTNIDYNFRSRPDVILDLTAPLPLPDSCIRYIYTEDFIEHLPYETGAALLAECGRVLAPGGVLRVLTPDLALVVKQYIEKDAGTLAWYKENYGTDTAARMLNTAMRGMEHEFLYDEETLRIALEKAGFEPRRAAFNESEFPALQGLDRRRGSVVFDAVKRRV